MQWKRCFPEVCDYGQQFRNSAIVRLCLRYRRRWRWPSELDSRRSRDRSGERRTLDVAPGFRGIEDCGRGMSTGFVLEGQLKNGVGGCATQTTGFDFVPGRPSASSENSAISVSVAASRRTTTPSRLMTFPRIAGWPRSRPPAPPRAASRLQGCLHRWLLQLQCRELWASA
jgi:hypothetical protein